MMKGYGDCFSKFRTLERLLADPSAGRVAAARYHFHQRVLYDAQLHPQTDSLDGSARARLQCT